MTKREMFATINAYFATMNADAKVGEATVAEVSAFCLKEIENLSKKSTSTHKVTDEQKSIREEILSILGTANEPMSISEMQKASAILGVCTTSKISGNMRVIGIRNGKTPNPEGVILRSVDGKTAKFSLVDSADIAE